MSRQVSNFKLEVAKLVKDISFELQYQGLEVIISDELTNLSRLNNIPAHVPLMQTQVIPFQGNLKLLLQITFSGWQLTPQTKHFALSDFGANMPEIIDSESMGRVADQVKQTINLLRFAPLALVVHAQDGSELVHHLYQKRLDGKYKLLCARYPFSLSNPMTYEGSNVVLDLNCNSVDIYHANPEASAMPIGESATAHFAQSDTPSTLEIPGVIDDLTTIEPIKQKIMFLTGSSTQTYEQAVTIEINLDSDDFGTSSERASIELLERDLQAALPEESKLDGHEFGDRQAILYIYGTSANKIFKTIKGILKKSAFRHIEVTLHYEAHNNLNVETKTFKL